MGSYGVKSFSVSFETKKLQAKQNFPWPFVHKLGIWATVGKRPDSILKTKPNNLICYQILPIVHQIVDENCRQFLNNYEK